MTSPPFNHERFAKLLSLLESDNDGEALNAARAAVRLARGAGLSMGEALSQHSPAITAGSRLGDAWHAGFNTGVAGLRDVIDELERLRGEVTALRLKKSRDERYQSGRLDGQREGEDRANAAWESRDLYQSGYRAGFDAGTESERAATNRAYVRGLADGKAAASPAPKPRRRKGVRHA